MCSRIQMFTGESLLEHVGDGRSDIAGCDEAKKLLEEAVVLPMLIPDYFTGMHTTFSSVFDSILGNFLIAKGFGGRGRVC